MTGDVSLLYMEQLLSMSLPSIMEDTGCSLEIPSQDMYTLFNLFLHIDAYKRFTTNTNFDFMLHKVKISLEKS